MIRLFTLSVALLLLGACASTTRYHHANTGGDYYYGDSSGYYDRTDASMGAYCPQSGRYAPYGAYRYADCGVAIGPWAGPYDYLDTWSGWGYPYSYYTPYPTYGSSWGGSLWLGFGTGPGWAYPGYYNPWFGTWWPYAVSYPSHRRHFRDRRDLHREQALQAGKPRQGSRSLSGALPRGSSVRREAGRMSRDAGLQHGSAALTPDARHNVPRSVPAPSRSLPRGKPAAGIPVNWPVGHSPSQPVRRARGAPQPSTGQPRMLPRQPSAPMPQSRNDGYITRHKVPSVPISARPVFQPRSQPMPVQRSMPASRPVLHNPPAQPVMRSPSASEAFPSAGASRGGSRPGHNTMPRGRPRARD